MNAEKGKRIRSTKRSVACTGVEIVVVAWQGKNAMLALPEWERK
jgi:hypothetical protein